MGSGSFKANLRLIIQYLYMSVKQLEYDSANVLRAITVWYYSSAKSGCTFLTFKSLANFLIYNIKALFSSRYMAGLYSYLTIFNAPVIFLLLIKTLITKSQSVFCSYHTEAKWQTVLTPLKLYWVFIAGKRLTNTVCTWHLKTVHTCCSCDQSFRARQIYSFKFITL